MNKVYFLKTCSTCTRILSGLNLDGFEKIEIKSKGVKIGEVIEITLDDESYMALVKSSLNNNLKIPIDSEVKIANNGFIGSPYVEITMGNNELFFQNNDITENNVDAVSLEEIINNFIFN